MTERGEWTDQRKKKQTRVKSDVYTIPCPKIIFLGKRARPGLLAPLWWLVHSLEAHADAFAVDVNKKQLHRAQTAMVHRPYMISLLGQGKG